MKVLVWKALKVTTNIIIDGRIFNIDSEVIQFTQMPMQL